MSTPKINFFIQAGRRAETAGPCPVRSGKQTIVRVSSPVAGFRRGAGDAAGEDPGKHPGVPRCQPAAVPRSRTIVPDPDVFQFLSRCPDGTVTRTNLRHSPDPAAGDPDVPIIPNISR